MRRRRRLGEGNLSAEQLVSEYARICADTAASGASPEVARHTGICALAELGYSCVDVFRARVWLRIGKRPGYVWDEGVPRYRDPLIEDREDTDDPAEGRLDDDDH
ncbi:MAG: hypothetical protein M3Y26_09310 [Actinomycetota bacterium]|nr:hypothetical protein [Actinomycetota bacterium]